jgi:competence protein ComEA
MKAHIKNYMSLTKKEWNGMVVLLIVIALVLAAPYVSQWLRKDSTINVSEFKAVLAQLNKANHSGQGSSVSNDVVNKSVTLSKFNPNGLSVQQWVALGLTERQATIIKNYEAKGGRFYKAADLKKIYGLTQQDYNRLAPYINLPSGNYSTAGKSIVELNTADSAKLTTVQGIGPAFATRIIYYRERLGGFINKEQLKDIYGLDDIKYKEISSSLRVNPAHIRKISINTVTFDKLRLMPYLSYKQVNAIIEYRKQHGNYASVKDLKNIAILDDVILRKIGPYLVF